MENIRKEWMFHRQLFVFTCFNLSLSYETLKERLDRNRVQQLSSGSILVLPSINAGEKVNYVGVHFPSIIFQYLLLDISLSHTNSLPPPPPPLNSTYPSISSLLIWIKGRQGIELHSTLSSTIDHYDCLGLLSTLPGDVEIHSPKLEEMLHFSEN